MCVSHAGFFGLGLLQKHTSGTTPAVLEKIETKYIMVEPLFLERSVSYMCYMGNAFVI